VVFFHGLLLKGCERAWDHTRRNSKDELWPVKWLGQPRVMSIDSQAFKSNNGGSWWSSCPTPCCTSSGWWEPWRATPSTGYMSVLAPTANCTQ